MQAKLPQTRTPRELVDDNRRFYDSLWSGCRLVEPDRFNTWPLVQSLLPPSGLRLEVAPGLRPRLPIDATQFVDISAPALKMLSERGGRVTLGEVTALPFAGRYIRPGVRARHHRACRRRRRCVVGDIASCKARRQFADLNSVASVPLDPVR